MRGAQLVREAQRALAAHPPRVAGARRDAAIDRLCVMHRHERTVFWDRGRVDATRIRQPVEEVAHARGLRAQVGHVHRVGKRLDGDALDHLDAVHLEPEDLRGVVGDEAHRPNAELVEH